MDRTQIDLAATISGAILPAIPETETDFRSDMEAVLSGAEQATPEEMSTWWDEGDTAMATYCSVLDTGWKEMVWSIWNGTPPV